MAVAFASGPRFVVGIWINGLELDRSVLFLNVWAAKIVLLLVVLQVLFYCAISSLLCSAGTGSFFCVLCRLFIVPGFLLGFVEMCREICTLDWIGVKFCS